MPEVQSRPQNAGRRPDEFGQGGWPFPSCFKGHLSVTKRRSGVSPLPAPLLLLQSKKQLSQFRKFFYVFGAYNVADDGGLRSGMYLIEMLLGCWLGDEHVDALAKCTVNQQIWIRVTRVCKTPAVMRGPFSQ